MKLIKIQQSNATTGYLIIATLSVILYTLAFRDTNTIVFAIPLLLVFILGASIDKGSPEKDIAAVGFTDKHPEIFIPVGIMGGLIALFIGSLIIAFTEQNIATLIPDFSGVKFAAVVPPTVALSANIVAQWIIIAPSEEAMARVVAPFAFMSIAKNAVIAYIAGSGLWILMHYPTYLIQNASNAMYLVLVVLAAITLAVFFLTKSLFASIIAHSTFNTGVLVLGGSFINPYIIYTIGGILAILAFIMLKGGK